MPKKIYSKDGKTLLHIINRVEEIVSRQDILPENHFLQLATLTLKQKKTFAAHKHIWKAPIGDQVIAQESWVVISGRVKCYFYDLDDSLLETEILNPGDCSITLQGGHNYEILDDAIVYEYKTGPYLGQKFDKVFI